MNSNFLLKALTILFSINFGLFACCAQELNGSTLLISNNENSMIVVKVTYIVKENYINTNKEFIQSFMNDFKKYDHSQFLYSVYQTENDQTFVHISHYQNKEIQQKLLNTKSFIHFQEQRDKNLVSKPSI